MQDVRNGPSVRGRTGDAELKHRKRVYAALMVLHLAGFVAAGLLGAAGLLPGMWWLAIALVVVTGLLPWVAVVIANDREPRGGRWERRHGTPRSRPRAAPG